ncbi:unnamed protein product [Ilex paraguariensis]|uniref:Uncharacterized protein n=1 Tax=Ilex paraguariensis TaxID=185542 RepID=A0ABC8SZG4_9AQUA
MKASRTEEQQCSLKFQDRSPPIHSYLFGSDFVSVDAIGRVLIVSVPLVPLKEFCDSKGTSASSTLLLGCLKQDSFHSRALPEKCKETTMGGNYVSTSQERTETKNLPTPGLCNPGAQQEETLAGAERIIQTPVPQGNLPSEGDSNGGMPNVVENKSTMLLAEEVSNDFRDIELSPRLTNFIKSGIVPESPIVDSEISKGKGRDEFMVSDLVSPLKLDTGLSLKTSVSKHNGKVANERSARRRDFQASSDNIEIRPHVPNVNNSPPRGCMLAVQDVEEIHIPLANLSNNYSSKDWRLSSGGNSEGVEQKRKFKRLRKFGNLHKRPPKVGEEQNIDPTATLTSCANASHVAVEHRRGEKKLVKDARVFIEEEAEVSSEVSISDDERDELDNNSYEDSFIDDTIDPTSASSQANASRSDMMAVYRHSLLTQSPVDRLANIFTDSPDSVVCKTRIYESGSSSGTTNHSLQSHQFGVGSSDRNSSSFQLNPERVTLEAMPNTSSIPLSVPKEKESKIESRKRKLSFYQTASIPAVNLEQEFRFHSEAAGIDSFFQGQVERTEANVNVLDDDQFYGGIDLDAVEEQAAKLLRVKSELSMNIKIMNSEPIPQSLGILGSPSFDLGI